MAERVPFRPRVGALAILIAAVLVLARPALPVLGLGLATALAGRLGARGGVEATNPLLLFALLAVASLLGLVLAPCTLVASLLVNAV